VIDGRSIHNLFAGASPDRARKQDDFVVLGHAGPAFVAWSRAGHATLLVPLAESPQAIARFAAGFSVTPHSSVEFHYQARDWTQAAAVIECLDDAMRGAFCALIADVANRLPNQTNAIRWPNVLSLVDEWQALLASRGRLSAERELGLWGELWLIAESRAPDRLLAGWRGPEASPFDFLCGGVAVEVKASRQPHTHHFSLSQIGKPAGDLEAYVLSMWVNIDHSDRS
jgi:hypothetical protein